MKMLRILFVLPEYKFCFFGSWAWRIWRSSWMCWLNFWKFYCKRNFGYKGYNQLKHPLIVFQISFELWIQFTVPYMKYNTLMVFFIPTCCKDYGVWVCESKWIMTWKWTRKFVDLPCNLIARMIVGVMKGMLIFDVEFFLGDRDMLNAWYVVHLPFLFIFVQTLESAFYSL